MGRDVKSRIKTLHSPTFQAKVAPYHGNKILTESFLNRLAIDPRKCEYAPYPNEPAASECYANCHILSPPSIGHNPRTRE